MPWKRRPNARTTLERARNIADLRGLARCRVPGLAFEYVEGGAEDESALRGNRAALERLHLVPQTLIDTSRRQLRTAILGASAEAPLVIAPTGLNNMLHPQGDLVLARCAARRGIPFTLSTLSTTRLEEIATGAGGRLWMQLYVFKERAIARDIMQRAAAAGYEALVFTTDANVFGSREWDQRNFSAPGRPTPRAALDTLRHPRWLYDMLVRHGIPRFRNVEAFLPPGKASAVGGSTVLPGLFEASITWEDIAWIRQFWRGKLLLKGVLTAGDAERARALGCDGIVLSNHGGRQLDYCVAGIDALPEIAAAVGRRMSLIVDGGFRRGSDVIKALALGAEAVMLGRATLYGLAAGGEAGVARALEMLCTETDRVLGMLGCNAVSELGAQHVRRA